MEEVTEKNKKKRGAFKEFQHRDSRSHLKENRLGKHIANIIISVVVIQLGVLKKGDSKMADRIVNVFNMVMTRLFPSELSTTRRERNAALKCHLQYEEAWDILSMSGRIGENGFTPTCVNGILDYMRLKGREIRTLLIMVLFEDDEDRANIERFLGVFAKERNLDIALKTLNNSVTKSVRKRSSKSPIDAFGPLLPKEEEYAEAMIQSNTLVMELGLLTLGAEPAADVKLRRSVDLESSCSSTVSENCAITAYAGAAVDYDIPDHSCIDETDGKNGDDTVIDNIKLEKSPLGVKTRGTKCPKDYYGEWDFS